MGGILGSMRNQLLLVCSAGTTLVLLTAGIALSVQSRAVSTLGAELDKAGAATASMQSILGSADSSLWASCIVTGIVCIVAFGSFLWVLQTHLVARSRTLADDLKRLASGDFSRPASLDHCSEFAHVAASAETIRKDLGSLIAQMREGVVTLKQGVNAVANDASRVSDSSLEQSPAASSTAESMQAVSRSMKTITDNAESANRLSHDSLKHRATCSTSLTT